MKPINPNKCFGVFLVASFVFIIILLSPQLLLSDTQSDWKTLTSQANADFEQENFEQAISKAIQALELAESKLGKKHPFTVTSYYMLASFYSDLGYPEQAIPLYEQALSKAISLFGEDQPDTILIMNGLAQLLINQARFDEAMPLLEKVFQYKRINKGERDIDTLMTMVSLAQVKQGMGQYLEAERLFQNAVLFYENAIGLQHPDALFAQENLAAVYKIQGKFDKALTILRSVYNEKAQLLGEKNVETLITLGSLAEVVHKTGDYDEAEKLYQRSITLYQKAIGDNDPELYTIISNLASLYQDQGRYQEAEKLFLRVHKFDKKLLGEEHPNTVMDLNNLAGIYRALGKYGDSEEAYIQSLAMMNAILGKQHPETITVMNNLALLYENQGLYDQAEPLYKTALTYSENNLGTTHPTTLAIMNNLASLYESQGVFERSEPLYNRTIKLNSEVYGPDHPNTIAGINNLAYLYLVQEQFSKAEYRFSSVYDKWRVQLGERHQKTLKSLNNLARVYHKQGKIQQAETMLSDSLRIRRETLGAKHPDTIRSMVDLSALYTTKKKYQQAEELLLKTIALSEEVLGDKHEYTFEAINNLANLYLLSGERKKALELMKKGFDRRTEFFERVLWAAGENSRQSYIELHRPELHRFLTLLMEVNNRDTALLALDVSIQRKSLLLKITSEIHKIVQLSQSPELAAKATALNQKRKQLAALTLAGPTSETPEEYKKTVLKLENQVEDLQAELGRASIVYYLTTSQISVDQVFDNLEPRDVLVDYIAFNDGTDKMFAIVAHTDTQKGRQINLVPLGELSKIKRVVDIFRESIQDEDAEEEDILETGFDVHRLVWQPLIPYLGNKRSVYVVPDSVLHLLPFDAIVNDNENFLIEFTDLKILSSSRDLVVSNLPDAQGQFLILAGPDYDLKDAKNEQKKKIIASKRGSVDRGLRISHGLRSLSFEPLLGAEAEGKTIKKVSDSFSVLPGAEKEGKSIKAVAKNGGSSIIYLNQQAEEGQLRSMKTSPEMLHIATHGFFLKAEERLKKRLLSIQRGGVHTTPPPGDNPLLRAGLAFAGINSNAPFLGEIDTDNDGVLTALEVLSLNLTGTKLVVLSACETGVGEIHAGEGVYGLRRAFQEAGVKSVVNSLWPVSDEGTRRLMTSFYSHLYQNKPARNALKAAQLEMLNSEWNSPYYWASFVLVERRFHSSM